MRPRSFRLRRTARHETFSEMDTRHALAYALIALLIVAPFVILRWTRRAARRERREANRPIRITGEQNES